MVWLLHGDYSFVLGCGSLSCPWEAPYLGSKDTKNIMGSYLGRALCVHRCCGGLNENRLQWAQVFTHTVPSRRDHLGRIRGCGLVGGGVSLAVDLEDSF